MQKTLVITIAMILALVGSLAGDAFEDMEQSMDALFEASEASFDEQAAALEVAYTQMEQEQEARWKAMVEQVEKIWGDEKVSTEKVWVDYSNELDSRSEVDFEEGVVRVEVLVELPDMIQPEPTVTPTPAPAVSPTPAATAEATVTPTPTPSISREEQQALFDSARDRIAAQFQRTYAQTDEQTDDSILTGQLQKQNGEEVHAENVQEYVEEEAIAENLQADVVTGADGKDRYKVSVELPMAPEHIQVRAARYKDAVLASARQYNLDPALIFAVIHTESSFNPKARSGAGAYGLMQLIPRWGARDAYRYLYKKDRVIKPQDLYKPSVNIMLGSTYLHLIFNRYITGVKDATNHEYLVVCGYNWGPPMVKKRVMRRHDVNTMSNDELYEALMARIPDETKGYLRKIRDRKPMYVRIVKEF